MIEVGLVIELKLIFRWILSPSISLSLLAFDLDKLVLNCNSAFTSCEIKQVLTDLQNDSLRGSS